MDFPKKQAQRLIPEYLLDYTTDLQKNHPDPSASWGGGSGGSYTGGDGIDITNNVISVDNTVAKKSDIPTKTSDLTNDSGFITSSALTSYVTTTQLEDALDDYALSTDIPTEVSQLTNDAGYTTQTWVENQGYSTFSGDYNDLTDKPTIPTVNDPTITFVQGSTIKGTIHLNQSENSSIVFDAGGTGTVAWDDITNKPTFSTVATSGSYNDLSDKPTIPTNYVTTDTTQTVTGAKTFQGGLITESTTFGMKMNIVPSRFTYDYDNQGTIERTLFDLPTSKTPGTEQAPTTYTLATTDDIPDTTNFVTTNTAQTISGTKTFTGEVNVSNVFGGSDLSVRNDTTLVGFSYNSREFELPVSKPVTQGTQYTLATTDDLPTVNNPTITFTQGGTTKGTITLNQASNQTIALDAGGGGTYTLNKTTDTLTFTYSDNTTGTLTVVTDVTLVQS